MQDMHLEMRLRTEYRYNDEMKEKECVTDAESAAHSFSYIGINKK